MSKRGIVQNPLSPSEIFELGEAALQAIPRTLDAEKVRADLMHKKGLARDLGKFFRDRYAAQAAFPDAVSWQSFYDRILGKKVDLSGLLLAPRPEGAYRPIVIVPGLVSNNEAFAVCKKLFNAWRYTDDLNSVRDIVERPKTPYVIWVKNFVEADPELANVSAEQIAERKINTTTLLERLILELKYHDETGQHLDIKNWTLCAGSRIADGNVPNVNWDAALGELGVDWDCADNRDPGLRARAAVSP